MDQQQKKDDLYRILAETTDPGDIAALLEGCTYTQVMAQANISSATLSRVSRCVQNGRGYSRLLKTE